MRRLNKKRFLIIIGIVIFILAIFYLPLHVNNLLPPEYQDDPAWINGAMFLVIGVVIIAGLIVIIYAIILLIKWLFPKPHNPLDDYKDNINGDGEG